MGRVRSFIISELPPEGSFAANIAAGINRTDHPIEFRVGSAYHNEEVPGRQPRNRLIVAKVLSWHIDVDGSHIVFGGLAGNCDVAQEGEYVWGVINRREGIDGEVVEIELSISVDKPDFPLNLFPS